MARTIDRVIDYIRGLDTSGGMSPTMKQVLVNRIEKPPSDEELAIARLQLYGERPFTAADAEQLVQCGVPRPEAERLIETTDWGQVGHLVPEDGVSFGTVVEVDEVRSLYETTPFFQIGGEHGG